MESVVCLVYDAAKAEELCLLFSYISGLMCWRPLFGVTFLSPHLALFNTFCKIQGMDGLMGNVMW